MNQHLKAFWSTEPATLLEQLQTTPDGLTDAEAQRRLSAYGRNLLRPRRRTDALVLMASQFKSPIVLLLLLAAALSLFLADVADASIILTIVLASSLLGFYQERKATRAMEELIAIVQTRTTLLRDGRRTEVAAEAVVPGDVTLLAAGDLIPGDCLLLDSKDLFVDEATLTGETFPVEKSGGILLAQTPLAKRTNALFLGTHVVSGAGKAVVVRTGRETEFGKVSERLKLRPPETEFEQGVRRFGYLLLEITLVLTIAIFGVNVYLKRPVLDSILFALAIAVGLTPQLLPAIISVNLSHGARRMAARKVIVKKLASIENFGSMDVLCSDKTGTLTEGKVRLRAALDLDGRESERVLLLGYLNASYETGFANPIDEAIRHLAKFDLSSYRKLDEVPYDFIRKRLSILVLQGDRHLMVTKGAVPAVLAACATAATPDGHIILLAAARGELERRFEALSREGLRTLGVASKDVGPASIITKNDEAELTFHGFLVFEDPPKPAIATTLAELGRLGVALKVITGDNRLSAATTSRQVGLSDLRMLTGPELELMSDEALVKRVGDVDVFAEVEPNEKERIILALRKAGHVVGYMGDGINDASALHAADVGLSVEGAVDVAKEAADIVLLEKDLSILADGVREGRTTFANTLKYVNMATSANYGNMLSMAGASLVLTFLPLLPKQVLLTNLMTDFPEMTIATDRVDSEMVVRPHRWNVQAIGNFMVVFGALSSIFDFVTFGVLLILLQASQEEFRTGWFLESVVSAALIVLIIRTREPLFSNRPSRYLLVATGIVVAVTFLLPYSPLRGPMGFVPLPAWFAGILVGIIGLYAASAEAAKRMLHRAMRASAAAEPSAPPE